VRKQTQKALPGWMRCKCQLVVAARPESRTAKRSCSTNDISIAIGAVNGDRWHSGSGRSRVPRGQGHRLDDRLKQGRDDNNDAPEEFGNPTTFVRLRTDSTGLHEASLP